MSDSVPRIDTALHAPTPSVASSSRASPTNGLTYFPQVFVEDEPEQGLFPALLSKVKLTFASGAVSAGVDSPVAIKSPDKGPGDGGPAVPPEIVVQTEAQALAEAVKKGTHTRRKSGSTGPTVSIQPLTAVAEEAGTSSRPFPASPVPSSAVPQAQARQIRPSLSTIPSDSSVPSIPPSIASAHSQAEASLKRLVNRNSGQWRPVGTATPQVGVASVPEVSGIMAGDSHPGGFSSAFAAPAPVQRTHSRARFAQSSISSPRTKPLIYQTAHYQPPGRRRRSSNVTLPDSPSSVSLSAMIAANAELSQNALTSVPGFPIQDDTRSVRSFAATKNVTNVSRIIRRIRGEGLSKQYWMADESCKECYDCNSTFTAWRRKHHCRICGQIFCSRCASNIIGARRFGQDGAVRVCNICIKIMDQVKDDDDDDRRSITSVATSYRHPSGPDPALLDVSTGHDGPYVRSPFAASQLFFSHPNESLTAIDEASIPPEWNRNDHRPLTPIEIGGSQISDGDEDDHLWTTRPNTAAPFRRPMDREAIDDPDEDRASEGTPPDASPSPGPEGEEGNEKRSASRLEHIRSTGIPFPRTDTISTEGPDLQRTDSRGPLIGLRTTFSSRDSHGGLAALVEPDRTESLWRARTRSFAGRAEVIVGASIKHFDLMLRQAIARADLPHAAQWHDILSQLLLKVSTNVHPDVRAGDSMDVRSYVKIKKVPGGRISDSEYVDGPVISKNVAHKHMPRRLVNPRVMVVTFPLDYHRIENQFMSLEPIMAQEKDYLRLLSKRIIDVRPHIVLADRSVSSIAIEHLLEANIAVARNVKSSAISQVARCTQADVIASMDRLVLEPRLGRCAEFNIQTFDNDLIPGRRKTLMRFEGCPKEFGCSLILRGADLPTLRKVKVIAHFMSLVAYHLRSEIVLFGDLYNAAPRRQPLSIEYQEELESLAPKNQPTRHLDAEHSDDHGESNTADLDIHVTERQEARKVSRNIALSLEPYLRTVLSMSTSVRFPPPFAIARMVALDRRLVSLIAARDAEEAAQILEEETKGTEGARPSALVVPDTESVAAPPTSSEMSVVSSSDVPSSTAMSAIAAAPAPLKETARDPYRVLRKPEEMHRESTLQHVKHEHEEQLRTWAWYTRRHTSQLRPEDFQGIVYLHSMSTDGLEKPCIEPHLQHLNFYQPGDETFGQFLERFAVEAWQRCNAKNCGRLLLHHFQVLVHGDRRLQIAVDEFECPILGLEEQILVWNYCPICSTTSNVVVLHDECWRMSWGSYLEQCFYPPEMPTDSKCQHDSIRDYIRYFAYHNLAIRIHNHSADLYEPVRPSVALQVKPETQVILKNYEYETVLQKNTAFFDSVLLRIRNFDENLVQPVKQSSLRTTIESLLGKAKADRDEMVALLNRTYKLTALTDVLALNAVLRAMQDKVVQWDQDFADMEKAFLPSEKDLRYMTANHLKKLFANQDVFGTLEKSVAGLTVPEVDEKEGKSMLDSASVSEPPTPAFSMDTESTAVEPSQLDLGPSSEGSTPMAGIGLTVPDPMTTLLPPSESTSDGGDSDSTISAIRGGEHLEHTIRHRRHRHSRIISSSMDSDGKDFISRIPRPQPAPSIAELVKRFQDSMESSPRSSREASPKPQSASVAPSNVPSTSSSPRNLPERPLSRSNVIRSASRSQIDRSASSASLRRSDIVVDSQASDSETQRPARPKLRRNRTDQPPSTRHKEASKLGIVSDGERSYATNASRTASNAVRKSAVPPSSYRPRDNLSRTTSSAMIPAPAATEQSLLRTERPSRQNTVRRVTTGAPSRSNGKGKAPAVDEPIKTAQSLRRSVTRKGLAASRSSTVQRAIDRYNDLSRRADEAKRNAISHMRSRRARPVEPIKATVSEFHDVRDAYRDEYDSDSSHAGDNEQDQEVGSDDSGDSTGRKRRRKSASPDKASASMKASRSTSPEKPPPRPENPLADSQLTTRAERNVEPANEPMEQESLPQSPSQASVTLEPPPSTDSEAVSTISFSDRRHVDIPTFETSAPLPSIPVTPQLSTTDTADEAKAAPSIISHFSESEMSSGGERSSIMKTLTGLWAFRAGDFTPLEYPLSASEHIFADSKVIIRESEPTSIIAFTLSSKDYRDKMRNALINSRKGDKVEAFMPEDGITDRASTWDIVSLDEAIDRDDASRRDGGTHLKYDFESGTSTIFCRIFFAEQFATLRSVCQCEDNFVESLSRCVQFDAAGGKSGSAFLKTKDDRFIAKEISRLEMDALTKFAPAYFDYTRKAFQSDRPTVLAKIYGFFKIGYRNAVTGRSMRMNVLVMENLFYERRFSTIYDLKGSTRNRLIPRTGRVNEVLLDENLLEVVYKQPFYLREHSKRVLRLALYNDTLFLSNLNVMDYSLVVGVDKDRKELVIGIVDYIRTFTWDKKLESWVKDSAFLGGAGKGEPTIVTPKQYKVRFRSAMDKNYFPAVPDRWTKLCADEQQAEDDGEQSARP